MASAAGPSPDFPELVERTREIWDALAEWWDDKIGDGNDFQTVLIEPATERLLQVRPGEEVLDIACGAGRFARRMAALGARVTAVDHAERFINRARQRTTEHTDRIDYRVVNAVDAAGMAALGTERFDAAVCTMALMDMAAIEPLIASLPRLLKPGGRFVFSVTHPVFNSVFAKRIVEEADQSGELMTSYWVAVNGYAAPAARLGVGIRGQPVPQYYFHRSFSVLLNAFFRHGLVLDGLEEPTYPRDFSGPGRTPAWSNYPDIPPILAARLRRT